MTDPDNGETRAPLDISASADQVVALLNANQRVEAMRLLERQREDQPEAIRDALDRMVSYRGRDVLGRMEADVIRTMDPVSDPGAAMVYTNLGRLGLAAGQPRFPSETDVAALTDTQRYDVYASIIETRGNDAARESLRNGDRIVLGLRQENSTVDSATRDQPNAVAVDDPATPADESRRGSGVYDDRVVVLGRRSPEGGVPEVWQFGSSNTEPSAQYDHHAQGRDRQEPYTHVQRRRAEGEDVNGDGVRDLGRLREGTVEMLATTHPRPGGGRDDFSLRPTPEAVAANPLGVQRDTNADGRFDHNDTNGLQPLNNTFKIHRGSQGNTDSAGCQTIRGADYDDFVTAVRGNPGQTRWQYVLTETVPGQAPVQGQQQGRPEGQQQGQPPAQQGRPQDQPPPQDDARHGRELAPPEPADRRAVLPQDSLMQRIEQTLDRSGVAQSLGAQERDNVLAASYNALSRLPRVDHIGLYNGNVVGTYAPNGLGTEPMHNNAVNVQQARDPPAAQSLAAFTQDQQQRQLAAQQVEEPRSHGARAA
jgi:hypothetical protein